MREPTIVERDERSTTREHTALAVRIAGDLGVAYRADEPLGPHTTMGVGGPTPCFLKPATPSALAGLVREMSGAAVPFRILGAGSNLIIDDAGVKTPVISTASLSAPPERRGDAVRSPAGVLLPKLVRGLASQGLGGFEFLEGIPGSLGGSIRMNAGAGGRWIGDVVEEVEAVAADGSCRTIRPVKEDFGYRHSFVAEQNLIVTAATLRGVEDDPAAIQERIRDSRAYRVATQPLTERSSGCIFKNPEGESAGALLERLSIKNLSIGGAFVSERHANFIVNRGARCDDILKLVDAIRQRVRQQSGVELELEVMIWRDR
jgi:UDP-N-acetylmuramate dehydrogenase